MLSRRSLSKARTPMDPPPPYPPWLLSFPSIVALKACTVVIHDLNETAHALGVTAATLYEAVAQASPPCVRRIGSARSERA